MSSSESSTRETSKVVFHIPDHLEDGDTSNLNSHDKLEPKIDEDKMDKDTAKSDKTIEEEKPKPPPASFFALFRYASAFDRLLIVVASLAAMANGATMPAFSLIFGELTDSLASLSSGDDVASKINSWVLYIFAIACAAFVLSFIQTTCFVIAGENQTRRLRALYLQSILSQDMSWIDAQSPGELMAKLTNESRLFQDAIGDKLGMILYSISTFLFGVVVGVVRGWQLALILLGCTPFIGVATGIATAFATSLQEKKSEKYAQAGAVATETMTSLRTVWSLNGEEPAEEKYVEHLQQARSHGIKAGFVNGASMGSIMLSLFATYGLVFWFGAWLIVNDVNNPALGRAYSGGDTITILYSLINGAFALGQGMPMLPTITQGRAAASVLYAIIDRASLIDPFSSSGIKPSAPSGAISFKNVSFAYESRPTNAVLKNFSLEIPAGTVVALVGASGSGKSSIVALLERFYDPCLPLTSSSDASALSAGSILLDGVDLRDLSVSWLREQLGLVRQEPVLFSTSILENIRSGRPSASRAEIESAAKVAAAHEFIIQLKQGYDTQVGEEGRMLSGGQKQRVALARAVLRNPLVLLLDEATSALDSVSERKVQHALNELLKTRKRTTLIVAHRLSTIRNCDIIVCLDQGKIVEKGSHDELVEKKGFYWKMLNAQQAAEENRRRVSKTTDEEEAEEEIKLSEKESINNAQEVKSPSLATSVKKLSKLGSNGNAETVEAFQPLLNADSESVLTESSPNIDNYSSQSLAPIPLTRKESDGTKKVDEKAPPLKLESGEMKSALKRIFFLMRSDWWWIFTSAICACVNGAVWPALGRIQGDMVGLYYETDGDHILSQARWYVLVFVGFGAISFVSYIFQEGGFAVAGERLTVTIRRSLFHHFLQMHQGWHDHPDNNSGILLSRLTTEAVDVQLAIGVPLSTSFNTATLFLVGFTTAIVYSWKLALVVIAATPLLLTANYYQMVLFFSSNEDSKKAVEAAALIAYENVMNIRTVASLGTEQLVCQRFDTVLDSNRKAGMKKGLLMGAGFGFSQFMVVAIYALSFWYSGVLIKNGDLDLTGAMRTYFTIEMSTMGLSMAARQISEFQKAAQAAVVIMRILDSKSAIHVRPSDQQPKVRAGEIVFEDVSFAYPTRPNQSVLSHFSLTIPAKKTVAIVGASGQGKSTIIALLERFYHPNSGRILIDGQDITKLHLHEYRRVLGLVQQEPSLYSATIEDNLLSARPSATFAEMEAAAQTANIASFIASLPEKYQTKISAKMALNVSGGQKQRLCIARAVLRNPRVLLLDEATSALDNESEAVVENALREAAKECTCIVIAHRLSSIMKSDEIVVLQQGAVQERGTHAELLKKGGVYAALWKVQTHGKEDSE